MASPELAITKATLSATLFRADPTSLTRPAVEAFFPLLDTSLAQCSRPNVQKCKIWIVDNIAPSGARSTALGKFLVALSKSLAAADDGRRPSVKRRRLHMLYLLNDVLFHVIVRQGNGGFGGVWENALPTLVGSAAAFDNCPKHLKKLEDLIILWQAKEYFRPELIQKLRHALTNGAVDNPTIDLQPSTSSLKLAKDAPYILPSLHGDPSIPWYDLPAATWLPHLTPNSTKPMVPDLIRPIQLAPGPADKVLASAVKSLLTDVERLFAKEKKLEDDPLVDLNELGERIVLDEITGDIIGGETYYGWSRQFCQRMKDRKKKATKQSARGRSRSRSSSRSRSRSRSESRGRSRSYSPPSFKRPKLSSRSRSRRRSRSRNSSRSRRRNQSYSRSPSPAARPFDGGGSSHRRRSRTRTPSPPLSFHNTNTGGRPPPPQQSYPPHPPPFPPLPHGIHGDHPIPPPPPPGGFPGHWPIPPPMPGANMQGWVPPNNTGFMMPYMGGWSSASQPPPPPPPPGAPPPNNQFGRGNGGFRGRGRGGYNHGYHGS